MNKAVALHSQKVYKIARLLFFIAIVIAIGYFLLGGSDKLAMHIQRSSTPSWVWLLLCCFIYAMVLMIPFAPGMELGVLIMAMFTTTGIVAAWMTTVIALALAFTIGRTGQHYLWVQRLLFLVHSKQSLPSYIQWVRTTLAKYPYLTVALLLNIPGNTFIGGVGGIAIVAGAMGSVSLKGFIVTVAVASSFVPIVLISGLLSLK